MSKVLKIDETDNPEIVGQLGAQLARLAKMGVRIVDGFIVPIDQKLEFGASNEVLALFHQLEIQKAILRSSTNTSDYDSETIRGVKPDVALDTIKYMQKNAARKGQKAAIVVQRDIDAEVSGTIHSINPVTLNPREMLIEANLWMNHTVLSGISEPDMIIINRRTGALSMESEGRGEICLTPRQLVQLHAIARKIEDRMNEDISVDWAYDNGKLYVLHTRPFSQKTHERFK